MRYDYTLVIQGPTIQRERRFASLAQIAEQVGSTVYDLCGRDRGIVLRTEREVRAALTTQGEYRCTCADGTRFHAVRTLRET